MFDEEDSALNVVIGVLFGVIALVIALTIGLGISRLRGADTASAASVSADFSEVTEVGEALVKFYFGVGQTTLPADAPADVATIVVALEAAPDKRVLVSGFHDESGGAAVNMEIAKSRALAVRDELVAVGVPAERVLLRRPARTLGSGDPAEARRVEVRVQ